MFVHSINSTDFRAGKIELEKIQKHELDNYEHLRNLAKQSNCDFFIEKKSNYKSLPEYSLIKVLARRKWIQPMYVFASELTAIHDSATKEEIAQKIYETSLKAAKTTKEKTLQLARAFIK